MLFLMSLAGYRPIIEYCGGTEIGGGFITGTVVQNASPAVFSTASLGLDIVILDENDQVADNGELFLIPPSIGLSNELLNQDHYKVYFENTPKGPNEQLLRRHGDQFERLAGGYFRGHGRADDTMNLGGIKVSSAEIERTLNSIEAVNETAAIAVSGQGGGMSRLVVYTVLTPGANIEKETLQKTMQKTIKQNLNPLFKVHDVLLVDSLPRTASNKIMRRKLRSQYKS
jgi:acetyl-CoA synthetase